MNRTKKYNPPLEEIFLNAVTETMFAVEAARRSPEMQAAIERSLALADIILSSMDKAKTVEELVQQEMALQQLDVIMAQSDQDRTGIRNAQRDYMQVMRTIKQMRTSPQEYFNANASLKETGGDVRKMPRSRGLQQIQGNKARMQNRASFSPEEQQSVWKARMGLADKTGERLRELHDSALAAREDSPPTPQH